MVNSETWSEHHWIKQLLTRLQESIFLLEKYTHWVEYNSFLTNQEKVDACLMQLQWIGEIGKTIARYHPTYTLLPTWAMAKFRDKIAHYYHGIDYKQIRNIIHCNIPELKQIVNQYLEKQT